MIDTPPSNCWVTPSSLRQSALAILRMKTVPDTRRWASGHNRSGQTVRIASRMCSHKGSSPRTSPIRQSASVGPAMFDLCSLRRGQDACRCPGWRHRRHVIGSRHSRATWPRPRHLKQRPSIAGSTGWPNISRSCEDCLLLGSLSSMPWSGPCRTASAYVFRPLELICLLEGSAPTGVGCVGNGVNFSK